MDRSSSAATAKPPQISEMFQKFALAFKTKTFEFFSENNDVHDLLDSAEDFIPDQKVIILKPDQPPPSSTEPPPQPSPPPPLRSVKSLTLNNSDEFLHSMVSSILATVSSFEASYLQLQTSHVPFNEDSLQASDKALVSHLQRLSDLKRVIYSNSTPFDGFSVGSSCLEALVEENQSKLRLLGTISDWLQSEIDRKDHEFFVLKRKLADLHKTNSNLSKRLSRSVINSRSNPLSNEVFLSVRVFDALLVDACRCMHKFTKILVALMSKAGWDLDLAANSVHSNLDYAKKDHNRYALLSYVSYGMFRGFDLRDFGLQQQNEDGISCNGHEDDASIKQLLQHVSSIPMELLSRDPKSKFSRFCENRYQELIHPTMESSIFSNVNQNEVVLSSWRSLSIFYESFVNMASAVWTLHKLAFSFNPVVSIFQVERGVDFSMVYMEDITKKLSMPAKTKAKVGFTVIPGFKIGSTIIQSQVYLCGLKCVG